MNVFKLMRIIFTGCVILFTAQTEAADIKIATLSPDGSMWMEKMREGAKEVAEKTGNRVNIKYYPGGVMGDDKAVLRKIRIGQLHGGAVVAGSLSEIFPDNQIYTLPLKFKSFEEIDYVREHMDSMITEGLEKSGFVSLGLAEGGFAYIMSKEPVRTVSDLRRQKVWIPDNNPTALEAVKAFEVPPIPVSIADVRAALQTGLIDTVTTPPIAAIALQWHTQVKYMTELPFLYVYAVLAVDQKAFSEILPNDQKVVREVMGKFFKEIDRKNREDNVNALETLNKQGIQFVKPPDEALAEWHEKSALVSKRLIELDGLSHNMLETLEKCLKEYRESKKP